MMRMSCSSLIGAGGLGFALVGCNLLLDNQPAELEGEAGALATVQADNQPDPSSDAGADPSEAPSADCPAGEQACFGACVSMTDPLYGCGDPSCAPCKSGHGTMACQGRRCVVSACDTGYSDCNADSADGCEVDLSKAMTCGSCNGVCGAAARLCAPSGASFQCTNGCTPAAPLDCGASCVDPLTSKNNCGGCNQVCPVVANATVTCGAGVCAFACKASLHACGGKCLAKTDPAACGPACTVCPIPVGGAARCVNDACGIKCDAHTHLCGAKCVGVGAADNDPLACGAACAVCPVRPNATATCRSGVCGLTCGAGFGNCDAKDANGCEATFASDPLHCGVCGGSCAGQACVNGVCAAP